MNSKMSSFLEFLETEKAKEMLLVGENIKKLDRSTDKRLSFITLSSVIMLTVLGYFSFGVLGAVIFFMIAYISTFALKFSSKKNILLKYLNFYRTAVPNIIAMSDDVTVKKKETSLSPLAKSLFPENKLVFRVLHDYGDFEIGYAKFQKNTDYSVSEGVLVLTSSTLPDFDSDKGVLPEVSDFFESLKNEFSSVRMKIDEGEALLYLEWVGDYLDGRVEKKDDLSKESLSRQFFYYLLAKKFSKLSKLQDVEFDFSFNE